MADFDRIVSKLAYTASSEYSHPKVHESERLTPEGAVKVPVPAGNQLFWRINELTLLDNFEWFLDRKNEIRLVAVTVDSNAAEPIQFSTPSVFPGIMKGNKLPIGDAGLGMYYSAPATMPLYMRLSLLVIEDDTETRDVGKAIREVREMSEFKTILDVAKGLASAANPAYGTLIAIGDAVTGLVGRLLEQNKDDLVAYFAATYTAAFDNLGIGKHTFHQDRHARV